MSRHEKAWLIVLLGVCLALGILSGCGPNVLETHKQLNAMNRDAGQQLAKQPDPFVAQAGTDIASSSDALAKQLLGEPAQPVYYTKETMAALLVKNKQEWEANQPWYKKFAGTLLSIGGVLLTAVGFAARFYPPASAVVAIASPILESVAHLKQAADAQPDDKLHLDELQVFITSLTKIPKLGPYIAEKLKDLHLEQILHSPEAPDPQPATPLS